MKKLSFGVIIAIVIAVVVANRSGNKTAQTDISPSPAPAVFTLVVITPDVSLKLANESAFRTISSETEIAAGAEIKTSATGKAKLLYPNGTITNIEKDSHIKVEALDAQGSQSRIRVVVGGIWSKIKNVLGADEYYEVETENTVASVRGTIFSTEFRNKITKITGIENKVRVRAMKSNKIVENSDVEVGSGEETTVDEKILANVSPRLVKRTLADEDFRREVVKEKIVEHIDREDLDKEQVRRIVRKAKEQNIKDTNFIRRMIERRLLDQDGSPTPTRSPLITPRVSVLPTATVTPRPTATATVVPSPTATATPIPTLVETPAPILKPTLEYLSPKSVTAGQEFTINGRYFTTGRSTSQISQVMIGGKSALTFNVLDSLTIFATADASLGAGIYDVTVIDTLGTQSTLTQSLTIQ